MPSPEAYSELAPLRCEEPLSRHTTLRIGGPAEFFFEPQKPEHLADLLTALEADGVPWRMLGGGANTVPPDEGVRGAVIHSGNMRRIFRDGPGLRCWPGVTLPTLVRTATGLGLSGLEALVGVPGQVGGALAMNAGSADWGLWDLVEEAVLWSPGPANEEDGLKFRVWRPQELAPTYRDGNLQQRVLLEVLLRLEEQSPAQVKNRQDAILQRKNATQPVTLSSAGCAFKNPPGESAGRLIDQAGCKGHRIGGIQVSEVHANFLVNVGEATAADLRAMLEYVEQRVQENAGISLQREIQLWSS